MLSKLNILFILADLILLQCVSCSITQHSARNLNYVSSSEQRDIEEGNLDEVLRSKRSVSDDLANSGADSEEDEGPAGDTTKIESDNVVENQLSDNENSVIEVNERSQTNNNKAVVVVHNNGKHPGDGKRRKKYHNQNIFFIVPQTDASGKQPTQNFDFLKQLLGLEERSDSKNTMKAIVGPPKLVEPLTSTNNIPAETETNISETEPEDTLTTEQEKKVSEATKEPEGKVQEPTTENAETIETETPESIENKNNLESENDGSETSTNETVDSKNDSTQSDHSNENKSFDHSDLECGLKHSTTTSLSSIFSPFMTKMQSFPSLANESPLLELLKLNPSSTPFYTSHISFKARPTIQQGFNSFEFDNENRYPESPITPKTIILIKKSGI